MRQAAALATFIATVIAVAGHAAPARADRIDGDWCGPGGASLRIEGPAIRLPSGAQIAGDYERHGFRYVGPAGDPEVGVEVVMRQRSEEQMVLTRRRGGADEPAEDWRRCGVTS